MLQSISWGRFGCFLLVASGGYYLFVLLWFNWKEVKDFLSGPRGKSVRKGISADKQAKAGDEVLVPDYSEGAQPALFGSEDEMGDRTPEMFKVMEKAIERVKEVVSQGVTRKTSREELLDQLSEVLGMYRQLKGTHYQEAVNNFLIRTLSSNFSLMLGEKELEVLWN